MTGIAIFHSCFSTSHNRFSRNDANKMTAPPFAFGFISLEQNGHGVCTWIRYPLNCDSRVFITLPDWCRQCLCMNSINSPFQFLFRLALFVCLRNISVLCQRHGDALLQIESSLINVHQPPHREWTRWPAPCAAPLLSNILVCVWVVAA